MKSNAMEDITSLTPTICKLMKISNPSLSDNNFLKPVIKTAKQELGITPVDKCMIYFPDAIGAALYRNYQSVFKPVLKYAPIVMPLFSVNKPVTPVCCASLFTGAVPKIHGILKYEKPILYCDTLFDSLVRSGKKIAIVTVADSSMDHLFRNRDIDYFSEIYDEQVIKRTIELIKSNKHDFIIAYNQEYDDIMHITTPQSPRALKAMENHIKSFSKIAHAFNKNLNHYNRAIIFISDHGTHIDLKTGKGAHGENIPEDMLLQHFFGISKSER